MILLTYILFFKIISFNNIFIFVGMTNVAIFVRYKGRWDQNNVYIDHETMGVLVPSGTTVGNNTH